MIYNEKLKVKVVKRKDTYTSKLGFVNYKLSNGEWKFKKSYDNWDSKGEEIEFDNKPTSGFVVNSHVGGQYYSYSNSGREPKIRVWDPRGWEIEVTLGNFFEDLLPYGVTSGKGIEEELVYCFNDSRLMLVSTKSELYLKSERMMGNGDEIIGDVIDYDIKEKYKVGFEYHVTSMLSYIFLGKKRFVDDKEGVYRNKQCFMVKESINKPKYVGTIDKTKVKFISKSEVMTPQECEDVNFTFNQKSLLSAKRVKEPLIEFDPNNEEFKEIRVYYLEDEKGNLILGYQYSWKDIYYTKLTKETTAERLYEMFKDNSKGFNIRSAYALTDEGWYIRMGYGFEKSKIFKNFKPIKFGFVSNSKNYDI